MPINDGKNSKFLKTPMPFQKITPNIIDEHGGKMLLADDMGLGKSVQSLLYAYEHPELRPVLIICPAFLRLNWESEIYACFGEKAKVHLIENSEKPNLIPSDFYIINYDKISNDREKYRDRNGIKRKKAIQYTGWVDFLMQKRFGLIIVDECHFLANWSADRTKDTIRLLQKHKGAFLPMSGTPITSRPIQFYPILNLLLPKGKLPPWKVFGITYCDGKHNGFGWSFKGASNLPQLRKLVSSVMLRRLKKDVLKDLPDKIQTVIPINFSCSKYNAAERDIIGYLNGIDPTKATRAQRAQSFAKMQVLQDLAKKARWKETVAFIKNLLDGDEKVLVFGTTHDSVDKIIAATKAFSPVRIDGRDSERVRKHNESVFQTDENCRLLAGTIQAAGTGLTLTAATAVVFVELPWTPYIIDQASDRAHRIGQKNTVNVYYTIAAKSIETLIAKMLDEKRKNLDILMNGSSGGEESPMLLELMKKMKKDVTT